MPKRRRYQYLEELEEKVRRLERKMQESVPRSPPRRLRRRARSRTRSSSRSRSLSSSSYSGSERYYSDGSRSSSPIIVIETKEENQLPQIPLRSRSQEANVMAVVTENAKDVSEEQVTQVDEELSAEVLALLGEAPEEVKFGPKLLDQLCSRWQDVIKKGLSKEEREKIMKKYPAPVNCKLISPPKMNLEAQVAAGETLVSRDKAIEMKQRGVSSALTAIGLAMNKLCKAPGNDEVIVLLSDSARLLCDYQHKETQLRKMFVISGLQNRTAREALKDTEADQWLFGEDLAEKLKASKAIERSSKDLRGSKNRPKKTRTGHLNYKGPVNNTFKPRTLSQKKYYQPKQPGNSSTKPHQQKGRTQRHYNSRHQASGQ